MDVKKIYGIRILILAFIFFGAAICVVFHRDYPFLLYLFLAFILVLSIYFLLYAPAEVQYVKENNPYSEQKDEHDESDPVITKEKIKENLIETLTFIKNKSICNSFDECLSGLAKQIDAVQALLYIYDDESNTFQISAKFAVFSDEEFEPFSSGEGLTGQAAVNQQYLLINNVVFESDFIIKSGLMSGTPKSLLIFPVFVENRSTIAVFEFGFLKEPSQDQIDLLCEMNSYIFNVLDKSKAG